MPVVIGDNSISVGGKVIETSKFTISTLPTTFPVISHEVIDSNYKYLAFPYGYQVLSRDATNLVAWYKMENILDSSVNGFNLTFRGSAAISTDDGVLGSKYLVLNGANNYADIPLALNIYDIYNNSIAIGGTEIGITFSLWFKATSGSGSSSRIMDFSIAGTSPANYVLINKLGTVTGLYFNIGISGTSFNYQTTGINFYDGNWRHICWSIASDNRWYIYINGNIVSNGAIICPIPYATYAQQYIGKSAFTSDGYNTDGGVEDFRIYNVALTSTEVLALYNSSFQTQYTVNFPDPFGTLCDLLVVGGGGGGGRRGGGGGGAGALIYHKNQLLNGTYNIKVGNGGGGVFFTSVVPSGRVTGDTSGFPGNDSQFIKSDNTKEYLAKGGAGGHGGNEAANNVGGSAGGRNYAQEGGTNRTSLLTTLNKFNNSIVNIINNSTYDNTGLISPEGCYGNLSGDQTVSYRGGGGGGAGGVGMNHGLETSADDGYGGIGLTVDITGTNIIYAGGGNGTDFQGTISQVFDPTKSTIQSRGGGGYGSDNNIAQDGLNGTGGGGGGQGNDAQNSGKGGSGIVIIRYKVPTILTYNTQWTYNTSNANTFHVGNVGIGITNHTNALHVVGDTFSTTYSGGSKNFKIEHPLKINKWLYHGCIEGPRFDNIYRGKKLIVDGKAEVDIDKECNTTGGMTPGTFPALNTNYQLYLQNNKTFDRVKGSIDGSKIQIESQNVTDEIEVDWLVVGERHDQTVINPDFTDSDGNLICEHYLPGYNKDNSGELVLSERIANIDVTEEYTVSQQGNNSNIIITEEESSNTNNTNYTSNSSNI
jgi:hypothetical protein